MSLMAGIRCNEGVVLAACKTATSPFDRNVTDPQREGSGLQVIAGKVLLGVAGHAGLAEEMATALRHSLSGYDLRTTGGDQAMTHVRGALAGPVGLTTAMVQALKNIPGSGIGPEAQPLDRALVAFAASGVPYLYILDRECLLSEVTWTASCAAVGTASDLAESFLAFQRRVLWRDAQPTLAQARLAAYWTVRNAIDTRPTMLANPVEMGLLLRRDESDFYAVELSTADVEETGRAVETSLETVAARIGEDVLPALENFPEPPAGEAPQRSSRRVPEVRVMLRPPEEQERKRKW